MRSGPAGRWILRELESIRFRIGVLVFFLVIVPIAVGFIIGLIFG
jgi:hypothetical protein